VNAEVMGLHAVRREQGEPQSLACRLLPEFHLFAGRLSELYQPLQ